MMSNVICSILKLNIFQMGMVKCKMGQENIAKYLPDTQVSKDYIYCERCKKYFSDIHSFAEHISKCIGSKPLQIKRS